MGTDTVFYFLLQVFFQTVTYARDDLELHVDFQLMIGFEPKLPRLDKF